MFISCTNVTTTMLCMPSFKAAMLYPAKVELRNEWSQLVIRNNM